ncbi:cyclin-dependent kinase inhibitor 1-like [Magnolia sinica]|uniref:cyclin-dependent kinase inhibitor 1-like n=1 Tax=Magnolia sinica TaxID=86752 RepID=UPI00265A1DFE|nr:cyclin-dependent kinase inhibitor 1-like [Magnolia sinica]
MGKYMKKCKGIGEVAVMEVSSVGVRTRARALALATATKRRRPVSGEFRTRRLLERASQLRRSSNSGRIPADRCPSPDRVAVSRCSSNGSSELVNEWFRSSDPEGFGNATDFDSRERETTPSNLRSESDDLESTARLSETNSRRKSSAEKIPSEAEIEAFFSAAEKTELKRFAERYNYDVLKDVPLEGRYEWVKLK